MAVTTVVRMKRQRGNHSSSPDYIGEILLQLDDAKEKAKAGLVDDVSYGIENVRQLAKKRRLRIGESYYDGIIKEAYRNWASNAVDYAKRSARDGLVDDACINFMAAADTEKYFDFNIPTLPDKQQMKDIMRTAYKVGANREMSDSKEYAKAGEIPLAVRCLDYADQYSSELLNCQRALRDIKPSFLDKLIYRNRYGEMSADQVQEKFDSIGRKYDLETWWDSRRMKRDSYDARKKLFGLMMKQEKTHTASSGHSRYRLNLQHKTPRIFKRHEEEPLKGPKSPIQIRPMRSRIRDFVSRSKMYKILAS